VKIILNKTLDDALFSSLLDPCEGLSMLNCRKLKLGGRSRLPALKGWEGRARSLGIRLGRRTIIFLHDLASKTNYKRVSSHSRTLLGVGTSHGHLDSLDSPRPRLGGSHHLPLYSILCSSLPRLHPNGTFSRDSQSGVPKLSRIALPGLWASIASCSGL
jgi:hypothetical protein